MLIMTMENKHLINQQEMLIITMENKHLINQLIAFMMTKGKRLQKQVLG